MADEKTDGATIVLGCLAVAISIPVLIVARGFMMNQLWWWIITPMTGLDSPGVAGCLGLSLMIAAFSGIKNSETRKTTPGSFASKCFEVIWEPICVMLFYLFFGWIVHFFI